MEAKELMLGNYVRHNHDYPSGSYDQIITVEGIGKSWIDGINEEGKQFASLSVSDIGTCYGIPLSEEWLLKLGFYLTQYIGKTNGYSHKSFLDSYLFINPTTFQICDEDTDRGYTWTITTYEIKYVHTLQNVMYALTGHKLTLQS